MEKTKRVYRAITCLPLFLVPAGIAGRICEVNDWNGAVTYLMFCSGILLGIQITCAITWYNSNIIKLKKSK